MTYIYKKVDNNSISGQKKATWYVARGWQIYEVTPVYIYLRKVKEK